MPMPILAILLLCLGVLSPLRAGAENMAEAIARAMRMSDLMAVMSEEGAQYGEDLRSELLSGSGDGRWADAVSRIYEPRDMTAAFLRGFGEALPEEGADTAEILRYFTSDFGQRVVGLEIAARQTLLEEGAEDAAKALLDDLNVNDEARVALLRDFADANDLVESNVMGAMNANLAFYQGLAEGGAAGFDMAEDEMLSEIWSQEADIRGETEDWLYPYIALAYRPLSDEELARYVDFSRSSAGRVLNAALFKAFDGVFRDISKNLGLAAAEVLSGQDI
ncbi:MAG: DUF2059 domain-containing protein [Paracoccaceae bacterium]